jgi:hypothetical protein
VEEICRSIYGSCAWLGRTLSKSKKELELHTEIILHKALRDANTRARECEANKQLSDCESENEIPKENFYGMRCAVRVCIDQWAVFD